MPATASTRTATRWRSCRSLAAARALAAGAALLPLTLVACPLGTRVYFVPTAGQARIGQHELREQADALVRSECPRLMGDRPSATGAADFRLTVDRAGAVTRAELTNSSRDDRMDAAFGGLVAQLKFDPPQEVRAEDRTVTAHMSVGYSCSPTVQVATVELKQ